MASEKKQKVKRELPEDLHEVFEALVEQYRFHALRVTGQEFVSYEVLAGLVKDGWRPADEPLDESVSP